MKKFLITFSILFFTMLAWVVYKYGIVNHVPVPFDKFIPQIIFFTFVTGFLAWILRKESSAPTIAYIAGAMLGFISGISYGFLFVGLYQTLA